MTRRQDRVNGLLRQELSQLLARGLKNSTLPLLTSVTWVDTSVDLSHAKVLVSVMGSPEEKHAALSSLHRAAGFLRRELAGRVALRRTPELHFFIDESIEEGTRLLKIIDSLATQGHPPEEPEG